jgi:hypothetical protein
MTVATEVLPGFDLLPRVSAPVIGIDPSSKRIALAQLSPEAELKWSTVSLPQQSARAPRFAEAFNLQVEFFERWPAPFVVFLEEPFVPRDRREVPTHLLMYGVTLAAIGAAWGDVRLVEVQPNVWKSRAMGQGHGHCKPHEYVRWAESVGYTGRIEDEAAAIGVAVGGAILTPSLLLP